MVENVQDEQMKTSSTDNVPVTRAPPGGRWSPRDNGVLVFVVCEMVGGDCEL